MHSRAFPPAQTQRLPSPLPYYAAGLFWLGYALVAPLYRAGDFALCAGLSCVVFFVLRRLCPGRMAEVPRAEPLSGDEAVDELLKNGRALAARIEQVSRNIAGQQVRMQAARAVAACGRIFDYVAQNPGSAPEIRRFVSYHLPTVLKMLTAYEQMEEQGIKGENIQSAMDRVESVLKTVADAFETQLDKLFAGQALDISTDITVLEGMLEREGLSGGMDDTSRREPQ